MTPEERINEIAKSCGYSTEVVRLVLKAEAQSVIKSLVKGENAVLLGRCIMKPSAKREKKHGIETGRIYHHITCTASASMTRQFEEAIDIDELDSKIVEIKRGDGLKQNVAVEQIEGLM